MFFWVGPSVSSSLWHIQNGNLVSLISALKGPKCCKEDTFLLWLSRNKATFIIIHSPAPKWPCFYWRWTLLPLFSPFVNKRLQENSSQQCLAQAHKKLWHRSEHCHEFWAASNALRRCQCQSLASSIPWNTLIRDVSIFLVHPPQVAATDMLEP